MNIQFFDSTEEMFDAIHDARQTADGRVLPWQTRIKPGDLFVRVVMFGAEILTIYGEIIESPFEQDREIFAQPHMKHYRLSKCFSVACPEGEMGEVHVASIQILIDRETFELARLAGWPSLTV